MSFSRVRIVESAGRVSVEIDGVSITSCTGFKIERAVEPNYTKITFSIISRDLTLVSDRAEVALIQEKTKSCPEGFIDVTRLMDTSRIFRKDGLTK